MDQLKPPDELWLEGGVAGNWRKWKGGFGRHDCAARGTGKRLVSANGWRRTRKARSPAPPPFPRALIGGQPPSLRAWPRLPRAAARPSNLPNTASAMQQPAELARPRAPDHTVSLNTGAPLPLLGLGTFRLRDEETLRLSLDAALGSGYRLVDTAAVYGNEAALGRALGELLPRHGLARGDVFLTSKLSPRDQGEGPARAACLRSLQELGCDYLDLCLIHWPGTQGRPQEDEGNRECRRLSWQALERLHEAGKLRAIGVSNYTVRHLQELLAHCRVVPAVLQVEFHPELAQSALLDFCRQKGIHLQAYSSLGAGHLVGRPEVTEVARRRGRTPAQVLLRWALQQGVSVIPKSACPARVAENAQLWDWELSPADMELLGGMDCGRRYCWDPSEVA
ncbi:glyoxal reductase-like isoform X2 [Hemicordylus capensis]|uniref:glyoxal reductase-like isoform X2 n=1 Tax=Hemicordylus capensis TaxID=884348 RepID=UPI0023045B2A|nr:glyoxal reductase-like isoform X2 [Hemicordylus capensis]